MTKNRPVRLSFSVKFQVKYCLIIAILVAVASWLLYLLLDQALGGGYRESLRTLYYLDQNLPFYLSIMALFLTLFILILTLVVTLLVSHQIAGPVFRYEDVLRKIIAGDFPERVATRQTDQLKTLVGSLNRLTDRCRETFEAAGALKNTVTDSLDNNPSTAQDVLLNQIDVVRRTMKPERRSE